MKSTKNVLRLSVALAVMGLVACGDDASTSVAPENNLDEASSSSSNVILTPEGEESSSSEQALGEGSSSSNNTFTTSCGTASFASKCIDTEFVGETCAAVGCSPFDCFEDQKGLYALSCDGNSVMACDGTRWQYTNCCKPIVDPNSSSSTARSSSSSVILSGGTAGVEESSSSAESESSSSSEWCPDGDSRYDEMYEYVCKDNKWKIVGYSPLRNCPDDEDCVVMGDVNGPRCESLIVDGITMQGSTCDINEGYHRVVENCDFICDGSKWQYTPPPM